MAPEPHAPLRFDRRNRIKQGRDFAKLRQQGERLTSGCLLGNWMRIEGPAKSRLGVVTSRKVGDAVRRNRARRLLREAFRLHQHQLTQPVDLVVVARPSISDKTFMEVERDLLQFFRKARLLPSST